jgi:putative transposase
LQGCATDGLIDLYYLDESGFVPTLPVSYTWARIGTRPLVPYEASQRRRLNVLGALAPLGPRPRLVHHSQTTSIDSAAFLQFVAQDVAGLPTPIEHLAPDYRRARPCVVVLDNYSVHRAKAVRAVTPALEQADVLFFFLPPYSPELNAIETLWDRVKHHDLQDRSHTELSSLQAAVDTVLAGHADRLAHATNPLCAVA